MSERERERHLPSADKPFNAPRRRTVGPVLITLLILAGIVALFLGLMALGPR